MTPTKEPFAVVERMKIVAWLRSEAREAGEAGDDVEQAVVNNLADSLEAMPIERGDHDTTEHPLARMVAMDEEIEGEHPGWMTGTAEPGLCPRTLEAAARWLHNRSDTVHPDFECILRRWADYLLTNEGRSEVLRALPTTTAGAGG